MSNDTGITPETVLKLGKTRRARWKQALRTRSRYYGLWKDLAHRRDEINIGAGESTECFDGWVKAAFELMDEHKKFNIPPLPPPDTRRIAARMRAPPKGDQTNPVYDAHMPAAGLKASRRRVTEWVADNMEFPLDEVDWSDAPSRAAVNMLKHCNHSPSGKASFWQNYLRSESKEEQQDAIMASAEVLSSTIEDLVRIAGQAEDDGLLIPDDSTESGEVDNGSDEDSQEVSALRDSSQDAEGEPEVPGGDL